MDTKFLVAKVSLNPSRKINLGSYETAELNAGIEIVFDTPLEIDSPKIQEAFEKGRAIIGEEFKKQYKPYKALLEKRENKDE